MEDIGISSEQFKTALGKNNGGDDSDGASGGGTVKTKSQQGLLEQVGLLEDWISSSIYFSILCRFGQLKTFPCSSR